MSDDLDDQVRRAMKTLDDQVPAGYFEGLPSRTLARLEDGSSMESQGTRQDQSKPSVATPVPVAVAANPPPTSMTIKKPASEDREEDSGLHDIRSLASSTKARLSSRRSTQNPAVSEDDILASSSAGWKAVALPEPAKMVSLPSLAELPSVVEIEKADKKATAAAAAAAKAEAKRAKSDSKQQPAVEAPIAAAAVAVADAAPAITPIGSRIAAKQSGGKGKTIALVGTLVAAAAGVAIFMVVNNKNQDTSHSAAATETRKKETVMPALAAPPKAPEPIVEPLPPPPEQVAAVTPAVDLTEEETKPSTKAKDKAHRVEIRDDRPAPKEAPKVEKKEDSKAAPAKEGDPDFDQLLKEAGVSDQKKADKPKLDKKDLSGGDFKNGMNAVSGKARACYQGTQGTVRFKVNISPEGKVTSVKIGGEFAGKPEGSCVEGAVKSASFPAWDGAPKSFDYSYLLSD
ncbi:MAG: hypothetical protein ACKV2T_31115 [Kofleriaceae bacterium]